MSLVEMSKCCKFILKKKGRERLVKTRLECLDTLTLRLCHCAPTHRVPQSRWARLLSVFTQIKGNGSGTSGKLTFSVPTISVSLSSLTANALTFLLPTGGATEKFVQPWKDSSVGALSQKYKVCRFKPRSRCMQQSVNQWVNG